MSQTQLTHLPCPHWCTTPHANLVKFEAPPVCSRIHACVVAEVPNPGNSVDVKVSVLVHDDTETGEREGPAVHVQHPECMTATTATEVAAAITKAVRIATS